MGKDSGGALGSIGKGFENSVNFNNWQGADYAIPIWGWSRNFVEGMVAKPENADGGPVGRVPQSPAYNTLIDQNTGLIRGKAISEFNPDMRGMEAYRERALGSGESSWAKLAKEAQALEEQKAKQAVQEQGASAGAQARSQLAMRGGLSSGAAERMAKSQSREGMRSLQNVGMQGQQARASINLQDEQARNQFIQQLPGMENDLAQRKTATQQWNTQQALNENMLSNARNLNQYNEQMKLYAAAQQGNAMRDTGSGSKK